MSVQGMLKVLVRGYPDRLAKVYCGDCLGGLEGWGMSGCLLTTCCGCGQVRLSSNMKKDLLEIMRPEQVRRWTEGVAWW